MWASPRNSRTTRLIGRPGIFQNSVFGWDFYVNGQFQSSPADSTIGARADSTNQGIEVGVLMGCNAAPFYIDRLKLGSPGHSATYDFEGRGSTAHLEWSTDNKKVLDATRLRARQGQSFWMLGHSHGHTAAGPEWYTGNGTLWVKEYGSSKYRKYRDATFNFDRYASFKVAPKKRTLYKFTTSGSGVFTHGRK